MTPDQFNALPLEARQYIERQQTCLSCGRANDLDAHYRNYLAMKNNQLYTLRLGAVTYKNESGEVKVLYPLHPKDDTEAVNAKLAKALELNKVAPGKFTTISVEAIEAILADSQKAETVEEPEPEAEAKPTKSKKAAAAKPIADDLD